MKRKTLPLMWIVIILMSTSISVSAQEIVRVYSEISSYTDKKIEVPIKIENNTGLMGYKFTIKAKNLKILDVNPSDDFSDGVFNKKISDDKSSAEVIWTNSEVIYSDGELYTVMAEVEDDNSTCEISLIHSPTDTFDGNYKEAHLACDLIVINSDSGETQETTSNTFFENKDEEEIVLDYINSAESEEVKKVVAQSLKNTESDIDLNKEYTVEELVSKIDELDIDKQEQFIKNFNQNISKEHSQLPVISTENGVEVIKEILECADEYTIKSNTMPVEAESQEVQDEKIVTVGETDIKKDNENKFSIIGIVIAVCAVITAIFIIIIFIKRRIEK